MKFVTLLEQIAMKVDAKDFMNSYEFSISISSIAQNEELSKLVLDFLEIADSEDVCTAFNRNLKIEYSNLSDGMKERFKLFSTIYKCLKQNKVENYKNVVLILDEPDAHMHPEWSRRLLTDIFAFLDKEFKSTKFQIIFTTHSPFMLSDIIQEDVIYLSKNNKGKVIIDVHDIGTFGSNVHTLLKHSFFMDSTIGEFAKKQINEVIKFLNEENYSGSMNKEKAYYICNNLGEKFIGDKLVNLYKKKYPDEIENMEEKVRDLEKKINLLEEKKIATPDLNKESLLSIQIGLKKSLDTINNLIGNVGGEID